MLPSKQHWQHLKLTSKWSVGLTVISVISGMENTFDADVEQVSCHGQHSKAMRKCIATSDKTAIGSRLVHILVEFQSHMVRIDCNL